METIVTIGLIAHIAAGTIALISGITALGLFKRTSQHRKVGKVFFYSMIVVFVTAVGLSLYKGFDFLLCIALFAFFLTFQGVRSLIFMKGGEKRWYDYASTLILAVGGLYLLYMAWSVLQKGNWSGVAIYGGFGLFMLSTARSGWKRLRTVDLRDARWFREHKGSMGGAVISTMTAFSVTALSFLPDVVVWLGPALVLTPILSLIIRRSEQRSPARTS